MFYEALTMSPTFSPENKEALAKAMPDKNTVQESAGDGSQEDLEFGTRLASVLDGMLRVLQGFLVFREMRRPGILQLMRLV